jgi:hypothetical protein
MTARPLIRPDIASSIKHHIYRRRGNEVRSLPSATCGGVGF